MKFSVILTLCLISSAAGAASFNCNKASHITEKLICGDASLSKQDEALAAAYKERLALGINKQITTDSQRNFVKALRSECKDTACISKRYNARIAELKKPFSETFMYNYKTADAYDITFTNHTDKGFSFTSRHYYLDTPEENMCSMAKPLQAKYIAGGKAEYKADGCRITFTPDKASGLNGAWLDTDVTGCDKLCFYTGLGGRYETLE